MPPKYVTRFADALLAGRPNRPSLDLPGLDEPLQARRGILTTRRMQYNTEDFNVLGRELEYTIQPSPAEQFHGLDISLQLYQNYLDHWRLFAYCPAGMLFSVNLSIANARSRYMELSQTVAFRNLHMSKEERAARSAQALAVLSELRLNVEGKKVTLGTFDAREGEFLDVTPAIFVREFLQAALVLGHFRANKGYSLGIATEGFGERVYQRTAQSARRAVPLSWRTEIFARDKFTCQHCWRKPSDANGLNLQIDHIEPFSQGGRTEQSNLQTLCSVCNLAKGNRHRV